MPAEIWFVLPANASRNLTRCAALGTPPMLWIKTRAGGTGLYHSSSAFQSLSVGAAWSRATTMQVAVRVAGAGEGSTATAKRIADRDGDWMRSATIASV